MKRKLIFLKVKTKMNRKKKSRTIRTKKLVRIMVANLECREIFFFFSYELKSTLLMRKYL